MKRYGALLSNSGELLISLSLLMSIAASAVAQQEYPNRPIRMIVSGAQGGTSDLPARTIGARCIA
jgi:tripartite-type tricarboxylate transporter receptor subunit TctC